MENYISNLISLLIGFLLTQGYQKFQENRRKSECKSLLKAELVKSLELLIPRTGNLLPTINWETCNSSGSIGLLPLEEKIKINDLYNKIKNYNYEAIGVARWRDEYNKASSKEKEEMMHIWVGFSQRLNMIAEDLQNDLAGQLKELS